MKREKAEATYDSESTEADEETIDMPASGATTVRVKREVSVAVGSVHVVYQPRETAPIPATSVLDLGHKLSQTPSFEPTTTERHFSNSILDLMVDLPVFPAPVDVRQSNIYDQEHSAEPLYQQSPLSASLPTQKTTDKPPHQYPPRHVESTIRQRAPSRVVYPVQASPFRRAPRAPAMAAPEAAGRAETRTISKSYQSIAHGRLVHTSIVDSWDTQVAAQGRKCEKCKQEFPMDEVDANQARGLRRMCCKRVLPRTENQFARRQLAKPVDKVCCRTCLKDGPEHPGQIGEQSEQKTVSEVATYCVGCKQHFGETADATTAVDKTRKGLQCVCCQRKLTKASFSKKQRAQATTRRGKACVCAKAPVSKALKRRTLEQATAALGNAKQQRLAEYPPADTEEAAANRGAEWKQMVIALKGILRHHQSITSRRATNNLSGSYREEFELELIDEEEKLHMLAVAMRLDNEALYDDVCRKVKLMEGEDARGESENEHNTGQQTLKPQKSARRRARRKQISYPFLEAAKATAIRQRAEWMQQRITPCGGMDEPARKRAKRGGHEAPNGLSVCTEARQLPAHLAAIAKEFQRKETRTTKEVIEIDDSD